MTPEETEIEEELDTEPESEDTNAPPEDANSLISLAQDQVLATGKINEDTLEKLKQIDGVTDDKIEEAIANWRASAFDPEHIKFDDTFTKAQFKKAKELYLINQLQTISMSFLKTYFITIRYYKYCLEIHGHAVLLGDASHPAVATVQNTLAPVVLLTPLLYLPAQA